jgi:hypothetical protein
MLNCPHCGNHGVSIFRKIFLSPGLPAKCSSCGEAIAVTYPPILKAIAPGATLMLAAEFVESETLAWALSIGGIALWLLLHVIFVPLVKEK